MALVSSWLVVEVVASNLQSELNTLNSNGYSIFSVLPRDAGGSEISFFIFAYN